MAGIRSFYRHKRLANCECSQAQHRLFGGYNVYFASGYGKCLARWDILTIDSLNRYLIANFYFDADEDPPLSSVVTLHLFRLLSNGAIDTTFDWKYLYSSSLNEYGNIICGINSENGYMIGGIFSEYNGEPRQSILEVDFDGNLLNTFADVHPETDEWINVPAVDKIRRLRNGDIYVAGRFTTFAGYFRVNLARLKRTPVGVAILKPPTVELQVYPNPATNEIHILIPKNTGVKAMFHLYDATGRELSGLQKQAAFPTTTLNLGTVAKGLYVVVLKDNGKVIGRKKVVVE